MRVWPSGMQFAKALGLVCALAWPAIAVVDAYGQEGPNCILPDYADGRPLEGMGTLLEQPIDVPPPFELIDLVNDCRQAVAAEPANADARLRLAQLLYELSGKSDPELLKEAAATLDPLVAAGDLEASLALGIILGQIGTEGAIQRSLDLFRRGAQAHHVPSQLLMGSAYLTGRHVERDLGKAYTWFTKAFEIGSGHAGLMLAVMETNGYGVPKDLHAAGRHLLDSAERGFARGQFALAYFLLNPDMPGHDPEKGLSWLRKAAEQGNALAQFHLGKALITGEFGVRDTQAGINWICATGIFGTAALGEISGLHFDCETEQSDYGEAR